MLEVMDRATKRLDLAWLHERPKPASSQLDECFLAGLDRPVPRSLLFPPDLHSERSKSWGKQYSFQLHLFQHADYDNVEGVAECGYTRMPPVEETFAHGESSCLNCRAYVAVGQAGGALHTMVVLQAS